MKCYHCQKSITKKPWNHLTDIHDKDTIGDKYICSYVCYKRLSENNKFGFKRDWKIVFMDSTKHLGYAFQWFSMALALVILIILFFVRMKNE